MGDRFDERAEKVQFHLENIRSANWPMAAREECQAAIASALRKAVEDEKSAIILDLKLRAADWQSKTGSTPKLIADGVIDSIDLIRTRSNP